MDNGFISLHRKIREHWIWGNEIYLKWWIDLLLMVNYEPKKILMNGNFEIIDIGEHHTSETKLSERWFASRPTVAKFLGLLEKDGMIEVKKSRQNGTTIKVCNYGTYQAKNKDETATDFTTKLQRNCINNNENNSINILSSEPDSDVEKASEKKSKQPAGRKKPVYPHDSRYYKIAKWFADDIEKSVPGHKPHTESTLQSWADEARLMIETDKRDGGTAGKLLEFARTDSFWKNAVLSITKFRKQYDQLLMRYQEKNGVETG